MKKLFSLFVFIFLFSSLNEVYGQYTVNPTTEYISLIGEAFLHGVPDSIHNHLDYPLKIEVKREDTGDKYPGLQYNTSPTDLKYTSELNPDEAMAVNKKRFRTRASDPQKKRVDLIITIPKELVDPVWGISNSVKWKLGSGHEPSYTTIKKIKETGEVQVIIVYEEGVPPNTPEQEEFIKNNPQRFRITHINSHICSPLDTSPLCSN